MEIGVCSSTGNHVLGPRLLSNDVCHILRLSSLYLFFYHLFQKEIILVSLLIDERNHVYYKVLDPKSYGVKTHGYKAQPNNI